MRRLVILAAVGGAIAASAPAFAAGAPLPGCAAVNPGRASCTFTIQASTSIPAGVAATTTWKITQGSRVIAHGGAGKTTVVFKKGTYVLSAVGKGFAGAGKLQS
jgi:hypothetical protein